MGLISILPKARKKFTTNFTPLAEYSPLSHCDITFLLMEYIRPVCISSYEWEDKCGKSVEWGPNVVNEWHVMSKSCELL